MSTATVQFRVIRGSAPAELIRLAGEVIKVGTLPSSDLRLAGERVARAHAVLERTTRGLLLIDLGSPFGTLLNGIKIDSAIVKDGDVMTIGTHRVEVQLANTQPARAAVGTQLDAREFENQDGARVAEVVAMFGDTVVDVQHLGQARDRRRQAPAWLAAGGALVLGGFALFAHDATRDWDTYDAAVIAAQESAAPAPVAPGTGLGGLGFGLALLGLIPFGIAAARAQDGVRKTYTLGEGHDAALPVVVAGHRELPLVRGEGEYTLQFTEEMTGEVTQGDARVALDELIRTGRAARTSDGVYSVPLAAGARARVRYQGVTFFVHSVAPGRVIARKSEIDKPFWIHNGISAAAIGSLILLTQMIPSEAGALSVQEDFDDARFVGYISQPEQKVDQEVPSDEPSESVGGTAGTRHVGDEGKAGSTRSKEVSGRYAIKDTGAMPSLARNFDPDMQARTAGILGLMASDQGSIMASPLGSYASGDADADVWGQLVGTTVGEGQGVGGLGLVGVGRGGGGTGEGTLGLGSVGLLGHNRPGGDGAGLSRGAGFSGRTARTPNVVASKAEVVGGLDKDLIRRIVRAHINEVRHCYNQGLAKDPNLKGRVSVQFTISGTGKVTTSVVAESDIKDPAVSTCIAQAVRRWSFPKPASGGAALVTYPFILQAG